MTIHIQICIDICKTTKIITEIERIVKIKRERKLSLQIDSAALSGDLAAGKDADYANYAGVPFVSS